MPHTEKRTKRRPQHDVQIFIEPHKTVPLAEFRKFPECSIALDGYVAEPPWESEDGLRHVLNHHEGVMRLATRSTAGQAALLVETGLVDCFTRDGMYTVNLYGQDCDQDVFWSMYILKYPEDVHRPLFHQLLNLADLLDTTSGLYPVSHKSQLLRRLLWISEPYTLARAAGKLHPKRPYEALQTEMLTVVESCHRRIRATLYGRGKKIEPDMDFDVLADYGNWKFIREVGTEARLGVAESGIQAFVAFVGVQPEGGPYHYVLHRRSRQVRYFPVEDIILDLNIAEGFAPKSGVCWGSGDICGGSPRNVGSRLTYEEVCKVVQRRVMLGARTPEEYAGECQKAAHCCKRKQRKRSK